MKKSALLYQFDPEPSYNLLLVIVTLHGCALLTAWENGLPLVVRSVLALVIVLHLPLSLRKHWYRPPHRRRWLLWSEEKGWRLQAGVGESRAVELLGSSVVTPFVTVLHFKAEASPYVDRLVVFRDSLNEEDYRRLRVAARLSATAS